MKKDFIKDGMYHVDVQYDDGSSFCFDVVLSGRSHEIDASLMMITRGVLMASSAFVSHCYNSEGFEVCSYCSR